MPNKYTPEQIDMLLNRYFRDFQRPAPWPAIAAAMGVDDPLPLERLLWGIITGYGGNDKAGPRRTYTPTDRRSDRTGRKWWPREDDALRAALAGEGQERTPPCDMAYIAAVLARNEIEVAARWGELHADPLGRDGFGFDRSSTSGTPASSKDTNP